MPWYQTWRLQREKATSSDDFSKFKVDKLKKLFARERYSVVVISCGKGRRKTELLDLCEKAAAMNNLLYSPSNCKQISSLIRAFNYILKPKFATDSPDIHTSEAS